jgi:PadR family transcriptional regulator PadR
MDDRLLQQLKKGVLEMLVLEIICQEETYGYELMNKLKVRSGDLFTLKEGTLYPILYRLEDDGLIISAWSQGAGKSAPKKMYKATEKGLEEQHRRRGVWQHFSCTVNSFFQEEGT